MDIRDRAGLLALVKEVKPHVIVHTAAQPAGDRTAAQPADDRTAAILFNNFDTNSCSILALRACRGVPRRKTGFHLR